MPKNPAELHNASFSFEPQPEGEMIFFNDPFTHERLSPNEVPRSITEHPVLSEGINYLRDRAGHVTISIMGAPHGDTSEHDMEQLGQAFSDHDSIFFEGIGNQQEQRDVLWDVSAGHKTMLSEDEASAFGEYGQHKLAALVGANKPAYFADIPGDGDDYEQSLLQWDGLLDTLLGQTSDAQGEQLEGVKLATGINLTAVTILREWYMLSRIGQELSALDKHADYKSRNPLFLVGAEHAKTLPAKLQALGVGSSVVVPKMTAQGEAHTVDIPFDFVQAVARCAIEAPR